jgi:hypothetical protein
VDVDEGDVVVADDVVVVVVAGLAALAIALRLALLRAAVV